MSGGTFTITNGGIYGSMMSTPILNPPQSGILGMHNIINRPVEHPDNPGEVALRPMMYLALSYDHRIVDGEGAVSFLKHVKECIEAPERLLIGVYDEPKCGLVSPYQVNTVVHRYLQMITVVNVPKTAPEVA